MNSLERFLAILETENRNAALAFIMQIMEKEEMAFFEVYEMLLGPALNAMEATGNENMDIWNEHIRTSIIKTIVENMYPYVVKERREIEAGNSKTVVVCCPPEEGHSLGARMVKDIFTYLGFEAIFVGGYTPLRVLEAGLDSRKIDYIAISVSNPYHLISTRNMIEAIREHQPDVQIIVGGNAMKRMGDRAISLGADHIMTTFAELETLERDIEHETGL